MKPISYKQEGGGGLGAHKGFVSIKEPYSILLGFRD